MKDMVTAGLVLDMSDYIKDEKYLQDRMDAINTASKLSGTDGVWAVPSEISNQPATEPCEASEPTNAPSLRWDVYGEVGYPEMDTLEDMIPGSGTDAGKRQREPAKTEKDVYALSLFKDWDGDIMQNAGAFCALYGYENLDLHSAK